MNVLGGINMRELIFFEPYYKQVLWGGHKMRDFYGYPIPGDDTGEAWAISANPHGQSIVRGGTYDGQTLKQLWDCHRELFGDIEGEDFPLLVKIIDANDHLSIQVHPDDEYMFRQGQGNLGKTECWYILDCDEDGDIIIGHHAQNQKELEQMVNDGQWDKLLRKLPIHKGDFFYIPAGTVHAIRKGTLLLEVQQNSDTTYRLYDYGRLQDGKPRQLHVKESLDVISCPHKNIDTKGNLEDHGIYEVCTLVKSPYFTVTRWNIKTQASISQSYPFMLIDVISGNGVLDGKEIKAGDHMMLPAGYGMIHTQGSMELITTYI